MVPPTSLDVLTDEQLGGRPTGRKDPLPSFLGVQAKHIKMETLSKNNDKFPLHGMNLTSKEKPKWWECGDHVRGKKQSHESDAAGERGRAVSIKGDVQIAPTQAAPQPPAHQG